jgi:uncharacterized damage-inducible protein DinB
MRMGPYVEEKLRTDHTGRVFDTQREMLVFWKVPKGTFDGRMRNGWGMKECLLGKSEKTAYSSAPLESRTDHEGRVFNTVKEMREYWKVAEGTFEARRALGWNMRDSLLGREKAAPRSDVDIEKRTDPYGNVFNSAREMCKHYGRSYRAYACALTRGRTKEEALFGWKHLSVLDEKDRTDHLGQVFQSAKDMCKHWNVSPNSYRSRIDDGWSKKDALTTETRSTDYTCEDHLGNKFDTVQEMCNHYNIYVETYRQRIRHGYSVQQALLTPINSDRYSGWRCISFVYESDDKVLYFLCRKGTQEEVLSRAELEAKVK